MKGKKILIGPSSFCTLDDKPMRMLLSFGAEVIDNPYKRRLTKKEVLGLLSQDITGIIAGLEPLDREVMSKTKLKVISRCGSGMSNVDIKAAEELGISVYSTPQAPVASVAELTLGAMLSLLREIAFMDQKLHEGKWCKKIGSLLSGKTVAMIGFGRIAKHLFKLLEPFGVKVLAVDPVSDSEFCGVKFVSLDQALSEADIITIHSSGEEIIVGEEQFSLIKPGTLLLNAARGGLVDEIALAKALDQKRISGAWFDAFRDEPYQGILTKYPQVILTPHVGSYTAQCRFQMETEAVNNLIAGFKEAG